MEKIEKALEMLKRMSNGQCTPETDPFLNAANDAFDELETIRKEDYAAGWLKHKEIQHNAYQCPGAMGLHRYQYFHGKPGREPMTCKIIDEAIEKMEERGLRPETIQMDENNFSELIQDCNKISGKDGLANGMPIIYKNIKIIPARTSFYENFKH